MKELLFFTVTAIVALVVCLVSIIELYFTRHRHRARHDAEQRFEALKASYQKKIHSATLELEATSQQVIETAEKKAVAILEKARKDAELYQKRRLAETEHDIQKLVLAVTKEVLPKGLTYRNQKDLVIQALQELKKDHIV